MASNGQAMRWMVHSTETPVCQSLQIEKDLNPEQSAKNSGIMTSKIRTVVIDHSEFRPR